MMNVSIQGLRKQLQPQRHNSNRKRAQGQGAHEKTATADLHFLTNTQITHPPTMLKKPVLNVHTTQEGSEETNDMQYTHLDGARIGEQHPGSVSRPAGTLVSHGVGTAGPMIIDDSHFKAHNQQIAAMNAMNMQEMNNMDFTANNSKSQQFMPGHVQESNVQLLSKSINTQTARGDTREEHQPDGPHLQPHEMAAASKPGTLDPNSPSPSSSGPR